MDISGPIEWLTRLYYVVKSWAVGYVICFDESPYVTAQCIRCRFHLGKHRSYGGVTWHRKWLRTILGERK